MSRRDASANGKHAENSSVHPHALDSSPSRGGRIRQLRAQSDALDGAGEFYQDVQIGASEELLNYLPVMRRRLHGAFPRSPEFDVSDAVTDAILEACRHPMKWVNKRALETHLYRASWRNLANSQRSERRRKLREDLYAKNRVCTEGASEQLDTASVETRLNSLARDEADARALRLWLDGEPTESLAVALGYAHLSVSAQRAEVKRFKDRIKKRACRLT